MGYKILYVEDLEASSIQNDLIRKEFLVETDKANNMDVLFDVVNKDFDAYLFDFRLTAETGKIDAPALAQAIRTKGKSHKNNPIILISTEDNLKEFDKDLTSQNLFDFAVSKNEFRKKIDKYSARIIAFIDAYKKIVDVEFDLKQILGISSDELDNLIDERLIDKTNSDKIKDDVYSYCRFINISLIRSIGPLIGEDVLAARLGVDKKEASQDWKELLKILDNYKYKGILSEVYDRWWAKEILDWWKNTSGNSSLRRVPADERVNFLNSKFNLNLVPQQPIKHSKSNYFWTICMQEKKGLDPNEGFILNKKEYAPWQEMEYLSLLGALEHSEYRKYLSSLDKSEIRSLEKNGTF